MKKVILVSLGSVLSFIKRKQFSCIQFSYCKNYLYWDYIWRWSYIETVIEQNNLYTRASTKGGKKSSTYRHSKGTIMWSVQVSGIFSYTGKSATCTSSSIYTTCPASNWKLSNKKVRNLEPLQLHQQLPNNILF